MKIHARNIFKMLLPYGIVVLYRKYNDYKKIYKKAQKEFVFDIILSVGRNCRPTYYLEKHDLRLCANPLDWMMSYSLDTVVHLYKTGFNDFFIDILEDKQKSLERNCHWYIDCKNNIVSMHYDDIENNNKLFREKMKNRFEKINQILLNANSICFISNRNENIDALRKFLKEMGEIYSGKITYMNIRNDEKINVPPPAKYYKENISERLELIEYKFKDIHPQGDDRKNWIGNYIIWDNIMEKISIKMNFLQYILNSSCTGLCLVHICY